MNSFFLTILPLSFNNYSAIVVENAFLKGIKFKLFFG